MGTSSRAEVLLQDYNRYRAHTFHLQRIRQRQQVRDLGAKRGLPIFAALDTWCQSQGIDSRRWLYHLFQVQKWLHAPVLTQMIPAEKSRERRLATYRAMTDTPFFSATIRQGIDAQRRAAGEIVDRNRDVIPMAENLKRRYLTEGRPDKCMGAMWEQTYGYHPKSLACARCPLASQCAIELQATVPFDIGALRRGELTIQEAQVIAERASHGG